jgi:hypothetical protein
MVLAAPELVVTERIELLDEIEVAAELQHRMLADGMMRGEEGSELKARHGFSLRTAIVVGSADPKLRVPTPQGKPLSVTGRSWRERLPCAKSTDRLRCKLQSHRGLRKSRGRRGHAAMGARLQVLALDS